MTIKTLPLIGTLSTAVSCGAFATAPDWNYVEGGYTAMHIDGSEDQKGFHLGGALIFNEYFFFRGRYTAVDDSIPGVINGAPASFDIETEWDNFGLGFRKGISRFTDVYGVVAIEYLKYTVSRTGFSVDNDETGYSINGGVKSRISDSLEVFGELGFINVNGEDFQDISDIGVNIGAYYYFTDQFAIGTDYRRVDETYLINASVRYSF